MLIYKKATPDDAKLLALTRQKVWAATYRGIYPDEMIDDFDYDWHIKREQSNLQNPVFHTYLVMDSNECVGYFTYLMKDTPLWRDYHFRFYSLYLLPAYQGHGEGRKIFQTVLSKCRKSGYNKLYLSCQPQNSQAMGFYRHMGGCIVDEDVGHEHPEEDTVEFEFYI